MELIYAILIFFGAMTPNDYTTTTNAIFDQQIMVQTLQANTVIINDIVSDPNFAERIRTIDRTDD